jgi:hypothetical protein
MADNEEILDYEEEDVNEEPQAQAAGDQAKKGYVGVHSSGFKVCVVIAADLVACRCVSAAEPKTSFRRTSC